MHRSPEMSSTQCWMMQHDLGLFPGAGNVVNRMKLVLVIEDAVDKGGSTV